MVVKNDFEHLRANLPDAELVAKAEACGWRWMENEPDKHSPFGSGKLVTGWRQSDTIRCYCGLANKIAYLRGQAPCWPHGNQPGFDHNIMCGECGRPVWLAWCNNGELIEKKECFDCNIWLGVVRRRGEPSSIIRADRDRRQACSIGPKTKPDRWNGCYGDWFTVKFLDGRVVETCDLWIGGDVPERFWDRLPINATIVSGRSKQDA